MRPPKPARHDLLLVAPADWPAVLAALPGRPELPSGAAALVRGWAEAGRPVIARRPAPGDAPGAVPAGLPLPPRLGKGRVALLIPAGVPWRPVPPVTLAEAAALAPAPWRGAIDALLRLADAVGLVPRVFGALLWRAKTGLAYLGPGSDLDLLWPAEDGRAIGPLLDGLGAIAAAAPMAVDGEVLTPFGGVQWRELAAARRGGGAAVLAKSLDRAGFVRAETILGAGAPACR
ncbi:malonate decarboxylase holo-[acyl-carrier-protein] synthase [Lichenibacterium dinghuense]|uniref:malonate decarboxylase holo-[acyl-carrier-protein] synthase n=1 Tax=Lichenibacterium dinghuense TaxID=2895977 RepID=UPI001F00A152|nr:malonate decarboxylase holo-[acyl-carrier-protein] synthase [Lichenibacterium sp. 6Y81]